MKKWKILSVDFIIVLVSAFCAYLIRENFRLSELWIQEFIPYSILSALGAALGFVVLGTHKTDWKFVSLSEVVLIAKAVSVGLSFAIIFVFIFNRLDHVARSVPLIHWALSISLLVTARMAIRYFGNDLMYAKQKDLIAQPEYVLVIGISKITELYLRCVSEIADGKITVAGLLAEDPNMSGQTIRSFEVLGSPSDLPEILAKCNIHGQQISKVVVTIQFSQLSQRTREVLVKCQSSGIVKLDFFERRLGFAPQLQEKEPTFTASGMKLQGGNDNDILARLPRGYRFLKRSFDLIGSIGALVFLLPITLIVSVGVAIDVGWPLTFWQVRPGKNGRPFRISKFRTMREGHLPNGNRLTDLERTSRFGNWLRRTRLDEMPQLFNILFGDMSFVGPRPLLPIDQPNDLALRLSVRPGLTGWAQVNGGKDLSIEQKSALDYWYVQNASLSLDLKILSLTAYLLINGNTANEELQVVVQANTDLQLENDEHPKRKLS